MIPYRLLAYLVGAAAVLGAVLWLEHAVYAAGDKNGANRVQVAWDQDKADIARVTTSAIAQATAQRDMALQANEAIHNDYQTQLLAARDLSQQLSQRLRDATDRLATRGGALSKASGGQSATATSAESAAEAGIYERLAAYDAACQNDAAQLNALIAELKPQL
jgi:hypothetical protein